MLKFINNDANSKMNFSFADPLLVPNSFEDFLLDQL